jgi:hypothetical protein
VLDDATGFLGRVQRVTVPLVFGGFAGIALVLGNRSAVPAGPELTELDHGTVAAASALVTLMRREATNTRVRLAGSSGGASVRSLKIRD